MKVSEIYKNKGRSLSFEIFPPKKDAELKNIDDTLDVLCELMSPIKRHYLMRECLMHLARS